MQAAEGTSLDLVDEIARRALLHDLHPSARDGDVQAPAGEGADEDDLLRVLADVDEAARAGKLGAEAAHVEIAFAIRLGESEESDVEPAAVVEVELVGLVDHRLGVDGSAEVEASRRQAADHAGL